MSGHFVLTAQGFRWRKRAGPACGGSSFWTMSLIKLPWIQSAGHYSSRELGLCSFRVSLTDMPRAPPLGELSPQVTERAMHIYIALKLYSA